MSEADSTAAVETWKPVPEYEGVYEVSDLGRVRRIKTGRILRPWQGEGWYPSVVLCRFGKPRSRAIHILVASAFLGPRPVGKEVNHKNGCKDDPRLVNLEYITHKENIRHAWRTGLRQGLELATVHTIVASHKAGVSFQSIADGCQVSVNVAKDVVTGRKYGFYGVVSEKTRLPSKGSTILDYEKADLIRKRFTELTGCGVKGRIAREFGVSEGLVHMVVTGKSWVRPT